MLIEAGYEERYWYPDDGGEVWVAGYQLIDPESGATWRATHPSWPLAACTWSAWPARAATTPTRWRPTPWLPAWPLELRRDPENPHDPNAIAVHPAGGGEQVGWVPRELAVELAAELDAGEPWSALVLREQRRSPRDPRRGLTMLLAPAARSSSCGLPHPS